MPRARWASSRAWTCRAWAALMDWLVGWLVSVSQSVSQSVPTGPSVAFNHFMSFHFISHASPKTNPPTPKHIATHLPLRQQRAEAAPCEVLHHQGQEIGSPGFHRTKNVCVRGRR